MLGRRGESMRRQPANRNSNDGTSSTRDGQSSYSIVWVPVIFFVSTAALYVLSLGFRDEQAQQRYQLKFPTSLEDISEMTGFLIRLKEKHTSYLVLLFSVAYIYKQSFAIPGSFFMNLLGGALFGPYVGFILSNLLNSIGATICYLLSHTFGKSYVVKYFPDKVDLFEKKVKANKDSLLFFLLFVRLFPMSPNWALNIICPIVGIPIHLFFISVFLGMMPYNFLCVQTGSILSQISSVNEVFSLWTMVKLMLVAVCALVPGLVIKWCQSKQD